MLFKSFFARADAEEEPAVVSQYTEDNGSWSAQRSLSLCPNPNDLVAMQEAPPPPPPAPKKKAKAVTLEVNSGVWLSRHRVETCSLRASPRYQLKAAHEHTRSQAALPWLMIAVPISGRAGGSEGGGCERGGGEDRRRGRQNPAHARPGFWLPKHITPGAQDAAHLKRMSWS